MPLLARDALLIERTGTHRSRKRKLARLESRDIRMFREEAGNPRYEVDGDEIEKGKKKRNKKRERERERDERASLARDYRHSRKNPPSPRRMIDRFPILGRIIPTLSACIIELFMTPVFNPVTFPCKWQARRGEGGRAGY